MPYITLPEPKYPLTKSEKKWLKARRGNRCKGGYFAFTSDSIMDYVRYHRVLTPDYKDAAEFAARVAVYLAKSPCLTCPSTIYGNCETRKTARGREVIEACRLKHARLAAETEMEAESAGL